MTRRSSRKASEKPFLCVKNGRSFQITPQNSSGWRALMIWLVIIATPILGLIPFAVIFDNSPDEHLIIWLSISSLIITLILTVIMIRWMMARAEIVDIKDLKTKKDKYK